MAGLRFHPEPQGEELAIRNVTRDFGDRHLRPTAIEDDEKCIFRREAFTEAAKLGLNAVAVGKEWGGLGMGYRAYYGSLEEVARSSMAMAVTLAVTNLVQGALVAFGTDEQRERFLRPLVKGELLGAFSLSEPQSGSDAASLRCSARKVDGGYRLTGNKVWCSNAGHADLYLVMARTGEHKTKGITSFLVPKETKGFHAGKFEKKLGLRASTLAELVFEDAFIPDDQRIGAEGEGFAVALSQLDAGRVTIGTCGVGVAIEALERAWRYLAAREARGIPFEEGTQHAFAEAFTMTTAARALVALAADTRDKGGDLTAIASQAKLLGSDVAVRVTGDCIGWMGEEGVKRELEVERLLRDAKALQIVEGTNQIQKLVLARSIREMMS